MFTVKCCRLVDRNRFDGDADLPDSAKSAVHIFEADFVEVIHREDDHDTVRVYTNGDIFDHHVGPTAYDSIYIENAAGRTTEAVRRK